MGRYATKWLDFKLSKAGHGSGFYENEVDFLGQGDCNMGNDHEMEVLVPLR